MQEKEKNHGQKEKKEKVLVICLPLPENIANDRKNHWKHYNLKMAYFEEAGHIINAWRKANKFTDVIEFVRYDVEVCLSRLMDFDNMVARLKWPLDCLVFDPIKKPWGILKDDSPKHCWPKNLPTQRKLVSGEDAKVTFTLYPCDKTFLVS